MGLKKEKRRKKERKKGLWKLTPRMEIRRERGFPPRLENSLANNDRLFHSSHRPDDGDKVMTFFRQRSTLRKLIFCPKNGEHLILAMAKRVSLPFAVEESGDLHRGPKQDRISTAEIE